MLHDKTTHGAFLTAEETWPLADEYSMIRYLDLQGLSAQLGGLPGRATKSIRKIQRDQSEDRDARCLTPKSHMAPTHLLHSARDPAEQGIGESDKGHADNTTIEVMAETPDAARQDQTTHGVLLPAEETCSSTDEYSTIQ
jgi:hypothetical protein